MIVGSKANKVSSEERGARPRCSWVPLLVLGSAGLMVAGLGCGDGPDAQARPMDPEEQPVVMNPLSGQGQRGNPGTLLPVEFAVVVTGELGTPVAGVEVSFTASEGLVVPSRGRTDALGRRHVRLTLPDQEGNITVIASSAGLPDVEFSAQAIVGKANPYEFPIAVSGRFLVDDTGHPILLNGDTPWSLAAQLDSSEVQTYLDTRVAQGVNAIIFNAIEHEFANAPPENTFGDRPFEGVLPVGVEDFTTLSVEYWDYVEWIVGQTRDRGIVCLMAPAYIGYQHSDEGWASELAANGPARLMTYGDALGRRFGNYGNIVWVIGGDWGPTYNGGDLTDEINAIVAGIQGTVPGAIFTAHANRGNSAIDSYDEPWLDINTTYSDPENGWERLETDYKRTGGSGESERPSIWFEGFYENEHSTTPEQLRSQMYWSILGGAAGHFYGASPVWSFGAPSGIGYGDSSAPPYDTWEHALRSSVADDLLYVRRLIDAYPMTILRPDYDSDLVTSGRGSGAQSVAASRASDGTFILVYLPDKRTVTVDMSAITTDTVATAIWVDPRTGERMTIGEYPTEGERDFVPPSQADWLLLIEDTPHE